MNNELEQTKVELFDDFLHMFIGNGTKNVQIIWNGKKTEVQFLTEAGETFEDDAFYSELDTNLSVYGFIRDKNIVKEL